MIARGIREFVARGWDEARRAKDAYWAERIARLGPVEALRIADELRRQMQRQHPSWPTQDERADDIAHHVRMAALFRRADAARRA